MIYLSHASEAFSKINNLITSKGRKCKVLFLSSDYDKLNAWRSFLEAENFDFVCLAKELDKQTKILKPEFLRLIGEMSSRYDASCWWASRVAERNTLLNHLFLNCCYLKIAASLISKKKGDLLFLVEHQSLMESIGRFCESAGFHCKHLGSQVNESSKRKLVKVFRIIRELLCVSLKGLKFWKTTTFKPPKANSKSCILLHTYFSPNNLNKDGSLQDIYFPGLREWLVKNGKEVVLLPVVSGFTNPVEAYENLRKNEMPFINPSCYLCPIDYLVAIFRFLKVMSYPKATPAIILNSLDCTLLFEGAKRAYYPDIFPSLLYLSLFKRLKKGAYNPSSIICEFENMIPEKMLILGFRKAFPLGKVVSFQHGAISPNSLCYSISKEELPLAPLPDKIVCNGLFFRDQLAKDGFPKSILTVGPALRYSYLHTMKRKSSSPSEPKWDIFCPLPLMKEDCRELIIKVDSTFSQSGLKVCLKPHPMANLDFVKRCVEECQGSLNLKILVKQSIADLISDSKVVVGLASSVLLEAVCMGVEVIVVNRSTGLSFNPLEYFPKVNKVAYDERELEQFTMQALNRSAQGKLRFQNLSKEILNVSFNQVTEDAMHSFLD